MAVSKLVALFVIVFAVLIGFAHNEPYGLPCRSSVEYAAQHFHTVALLSGGGQFALAGTTAVEFALNELQIELNIGRHTINDTTDGRSVALTETCQAEDMTESVTHGNVRIRSGRHVRGRDRILRSLHNRNRSRLRR